MYLFLDNKLFNVPKMELNKIGCFCLVFFIKSLTNMFNHENHRTKKSDILNSVNQI